ncbi:MAG: hypothetical protein PHS59_03545 [Paludibacter sp.]|nr:hypothetical protein [Paludibacter sp.]
MASRRKLKKTIQFVSSELISDIYIRCLMSKDVDLELVEKISVDIMKTNVEFILRANRPDGKDNPKLVKAYYRNLFADWQKAMDIITAEMDKI